MKPGKIAAIAGLLIASSAMAQPYGMGPGMMGDYGYGMPPGMMGGYGRQGMGPGYGMGPGMMGPGMMGPGMMGGREYSYGIPDLTSEQRKKLADIYLEFSRKQWALMQSMHELRWQQADYRGGVIDEKAARAAFDEMTVLRKQMFENSLELRKRMDGVLTPQQREQLGRSAGGG